MEPMDLAKRHIFGNLLHRCLSSYLLQNTHNHQASRSQVDQSVPANSSGHLNNQVLKILLSYLQRYF